MAQSFQNHLEQIHTDPLYQISLQAIMLLGESNRLDPGTLQHSIEVARMVNVLSHAANVPTPIALSLGIGAQLHDVGKKHMLEIVTSTESFTPATRKRMQQHPELGQLFISTLYGGCTLKEGSENVVTFAGIVAGGHHACNVDKTLNYPPLEKLHMTTAFRRLFSKYGTILPISDVIQARTSSEGNGRNYRAERLRSEGGEPSNKPLTLREAVQYACSIILPHHVSLGLDAGRIEELFIEQQEYIHANFPVAA